MSPLSGNQEEKNPDSGFTPSARMGFASLPHESPETWILPLADWLDNTPRDKEEPEPCARASDEPPSTPGEFAGWDTMIMALMA